jgi:hypothetical protein
MIILPEISENSKTVLVHTKPSISLPLSIEIKNRYGSLNNVIMFYFPFIDLVEHYRMKIDHSKELKLDYRFFVEMCNDLEVPEDQRVALRTLEDFNFANGDNLISDYHRMDVYIDLIKLLMEKGLDLTSVGSILDPVCITSKIEGQAPKSSSMHPYLEDIYDAHDLIYRPFIDMTVEQIWDNVPDEEFEMLNKWLHICPYGYPSDCMTNRAWRLCKECKIVENYIRGENS